MKLKHITFTGIDEKTSLLAIDEISRQENNNIEWGVLYSTSEKFKDGFANRYPSVKWFDKNIYTIKRIKEETKCSFALHVCGKAVKDLLNNEDLFLEKIIPYFNRVQLNFVYKKNQLELLDRLMKKFPTIVFITQYNSANKDLHNDIKNKNHEVLHDFSGGNGIETKKWDFPQSDKVWGYAGGISANNIKGLITFFDAIVDKQYWLDMENSVRTNDFLDIEKVKEVIKASKLTPYQV